jgi:hypothetical protein
MKYRCKSHISNLMKHKALDFLTLGHSDSTTTHKSTPFVRTQQLLEMILQLCECQSAHNESGRNNHNKLSPLTPTPSTRYEIRIPKSRLLPQKQMVWTHFYHPSSSGCHLGVWLLTHLLMKADGTWPTGSTGMPRTKMVL